MKKFTLLILTLLFSLAGYSQPPVLVEDFEGTALPDLGTDQWALNSGIWGVFDNGVGLTQSWNVSTTVTDPPSQHSGTRAAFMNRENIGQGNTSQDFLATPQFAVPANGQLKFWTRSNITGNQGTIFKIMVSTTTQTDPAAYTLIQQYTEDQLTTVFNVYQEKTISLSAYPAGTQVYVAFVMEFTQPTAGVGGDRWLIDDVRVVTQCLDPSNLTASGLTQTSATLNWANPSGATQWEVEIVPFAATPSGSGVVVTSNPYTATTTATGDALLPSTQYKYCVRALCDFNVNSEWVCSTFTTSSPGLSCIAPILIPGTPYSTDDNTGGYADSTDVPQPASCGGGGNYMTGNDVFYSYTPTETGAISITMTPSNFNAGLFVYAGCANVGVNCVAGITNPGNGVMVIPSVSVTAGQQYIIVISSDSVFGPQSMGYNLVIQTLNCAPPTDLSATGTGPNSADLSWGNPTGATSWEVFVQTEGSGIPSGSGEVATTNIDYGVGFLTGTTTQLVLGTAYQYWVRADCGDGTFSPWSGPYVFNTTACSSGCNYTFNMTDTFGDGWNGNTMDIIQDGLVIQTIGSTFTTGTGPVTVSVPLCAGPFELFWNAGGAFTTEVGVSVVNSFNQEVYVLEPFTQTNPVLLFTGFVDCDNPLCLPPQNLAFSAITTNGATLSWTPNGPAPASYEIYAVPVGSPAPDASTVPTAKTTSSPYTIAGLNPDTEYVFYVRSVCTTPGANPWSVVSAPFTTLPTCPKPTGLMVSAIDQTSATFSWTAGSSEGAWQVLVLPAGSPAPTATSTGWVAATNPYTVTGLTLGTSYDFYVRGVCSATDISTWAGPLNFNTTICPAANQCLYNFVMTDTFGDGWNGAQMNIVQNGIIVATIGSTFTTGVGPVTVQVPLCNGIAFSLVYSAGGFYPNEVGVSITSFLGEEIYTYTPGSSSPGAVLYSGTAECIPPTCLKPTNVVVSNIGLDSVSVLWTENNTPPATSWDIIILPATDPAPLPTATGFTTVSNNPYVFTGLNPATNYKVYVRAV
ncbi:MAG TPA: fibronectin type III domain-containing protein, partial [Flavisolibacter sp.]